MNGRHRRAQPPPNTVYLLLGILGVLLFTGFCWLGHLADHW